MIGYDCPGFDLLLVAVTGPARGHVSSSKETLRSQDGEIMGSLPLREKWPCHGHGGLYHLFARRAAVWGRVSALFRGAF